MTYIGKLEQNSIIIGASTQNEQELFPKLYAIVGTSLTNVTGDGTTPIIIYDTIVSQQGTGYDNTTGIYTAPSDGYYLLTASIGWDSLDVLCTRAQINLVGDGFSTQIEANAGACRSSANIYTQVGSVVIFLAAGNQCWVQGFVLGSTKTVGIAGNFDGDFSYISICKIA
jgi:hypothetical protein